MLVQSLRRVAVLLALMASLAGSVFAATDDGLREAQRLYQAGRLDAALEQVDASLKAAPRQAQARFLRGLILTDLKRATEAIAMFTALTQDFPELPEPYNNLAVLYASQGALDDARTALERAIQAHPGYAAAHENLGDVHAQLARRAYERALQLDKGNLTAAVKLSRAKELSSLSGATAGRPAQSGNPAPQPAPPAKAAPAKTGPISAAPDWHRTGGQRRVVLETAGA